MAKLTLTTIGEISTATAAINNNSDEIEEAIENTLSRDGTSPNEMEANLDMNGNRILNLPEPVASTEPARLQDLENITLVLEGSVEDAVADILTAVLPTGDIVGTTDTQTLTNKSIDGDVNTVTDLPYSAIKSTSRSGSDTTLITGTEGTSGNLAQWNVDGDLVDAGVATADLLTDDSTNTLTNKTIDANGTGNSITNIEAADIATAAKTGSASTLVTGSAGANGVLAQWDTTGDIETSGILASEVLLDADIGATVQPVDADLTAIAGLSSSGLIARTGAGTAAARTLTGGSSTGIAITNGDGVAGNPSFVLDTTGVSAPASFNSGDKFFVFEGGVLKLADYDDLPGAGAGISNIVEDATPQLGGDLDTNGNDIQVKNGDAIQTGTSVSDALIIRARDVDSAVWTTFITLTAANTPTCDLSDSVTKASGYIYRAGGTDVPITDGGTGGSTAAAAATNLGLGTGDSPQFTGINLGHASDTTLLRASAGDVNIEGNRIYRAGGQDVALADGGTGQSLTDPNDDRIMFWDDSAGAITWLDISTGLAISTTNLSLSHLGIESLTDPNDDRIMFWDDSLGAVTWLDPLDSTTISGTTLKIASGTYTPTITALSNVDNDPPSATVACYLRVGDIVTVSGSLTLNATAGGAASVEISLPIASNFSTTTQATGTMSITSESGRIISSIANDTAVCQWSAVLTTAQVWAYIFQYQVI